MSIPYIPARNHGGHQSAINRIVIHGTVSATVRGGARNIANFFANQASTSAHYVVDPGEVIQCVYDHTIAWHDGTNTNSIGVELCDPVDGPAARWTDSAHTNMLGRAADLVRDLCHLYDVPMLRLTPAQIRAGQRGICGHVDMRDAFPGRTTHYDPGPAFPWVTFLAAVRKDAAMQEDDMPYREWPQADKDALCRDVWSWNVGNPVVWDGKGDKPNEAAYIALSFAEKRIVDRVCAYLDKKLSK
jgi:N-acetyl-anhydromuramyl-L-alanine amidase AmpD